jgi:hypothetical protein
MSGKKPYLPNNWQQWKEVPDEFLYAPTFEEFARETTSKGRIKEHIYQKQHAAESKIKKLMKGGNEFVVCTEDQLHFISPKTDELNYD